jgi:hypothetical protein
MQLRPASVFNVISGNRYITKQKLNSRLDISLERRHRIEENSNDNDDQPR